MNTGTAVIDYEIVGEGTPVLMLHGFPLDREVMKGCMEPLLKSRSGYRRLYLDLPGMGRSPVPEGDWTSDDVLECVENFIDEVVPGEDLVVVGQSYGCYLARGLLRTRSRHIIGICMICPLIVPQDELRDLPVGTEERMPYNKLSSEEKVVSLFARTVNERVIERYKKEIEIPLSLADLAFTEHLRSHGYPFSFDPDALDEPFPGSVLILCGRQDRIVGYRDAWRIIDLFPRATFAVIDGAGHYLQAERDGIFDFLVGDWFDGLQMHR